MCLVFLASVVDHFPDVAQVGLLGVPTPLRIITLVTLVRGAATVTVHFVPHGTNRPPRVAAVRGYSVVVVIA